LIHVEPGHSVTLLRSMARSAFMAFDRITCLA
jgi:hypothetical protein